MYLGRMFTHLKKHGCSILLFDPNQTNFRDQNFLHEDCSEFYQGAKELIPTNAPDPRGYSVLINLFVDVIHTANILTRRSHYELLLFIRKVSIFWYSEKKKVIQSETSESYFVAFREAIEANRSI